MSVLVEPCIGEAPPAPLAGWQLHELDETDSTNARAARLGPWEAVVARVQTAGRGRHARRWISDAGGLWLSAVVPATGPAPRWQLLPLAAGCAVCETLVEMGVPEPRLRWPNDVMMGRAKLAGILVERFTDTTAVIGLGVNFDNHPETLDPALAGAVTRLADLLHPLPDRTDLRNRLLARLRALHALLAEGRTEQLIARLQPYWRPHRVRVTLRPATNTLEGEFAGVDAAGRFGMRTVPDGLRWLAPADVEMLREIF